MVLDQWIGAFDFQTEDEILLQRLKSALENFYDKSGTKKFDGLRNIVDVFERLKTLEAGDKKQSVAKVIAALSADDEIRKLYDNLFKTLSRVNHRQSWRSK